MMKTGLLLKWSLVLFFGFGAVTMAYYYSNTDQSISIFDYPKSIYYYFFKWPKAPKIVDQQVEGSCGTRIFWADYELNEDGVYFYRRVVGEANFNAIESRPPHAGVPGSFDDSNLPVGTYEYKVSVFNEYHERFSNISEQLTISNDVCGDEPILIKPLNPVITALERVKGSTCAVRVYFNDNSLDEDGIRVYRSEWNDPDVLLADLPPNNGPTGSYDDTNIPPGHYTYQISVYSANGESFSQLSDEIEITEETCNPSNVNPGAILAITPPNPALVSTFTPTPTANAQVCIWKASINVFVRKGPGASLYSDITGVVPETMLPVVGQSEDEQFWAVEVQPDVIGYIPKGEKFGLISGDCDLIPTLQDPVPPPSPVPTKEPVSSLPQCSDELDNDKDGLIDMRDRECSSPNDDSE